MGSQYTTSTSGYCKHCYERIKLKPAVEGQYPLWVKVKSPPHINSTSCPKSDDGYHEKR